MKKTKGFSYDSEIDIDVIEHINKQPRQGQYIIDLIRKDMNEPDQIELIVRNYVDKLLKERQIKIDNKKEGSISKNDITALLNLGKQ